MANLNETARWEAGIYQFETSDPVMGGPNGIDNRPTRELANRTLWLKTELAKAVQSIGSLQGISITAGAGLVGGGNLSASLSLALATPSTLSGNTNNWAGNGNTGHTHELAKATATLAGVVRLIDNLTAGGRDAALSAEQGKALKKAVDDIGAAFLPLTGGAISGTLELQGYNALSWRSTTAPKPYAMHFLRGNVPYMALVTNPAHIEKKWGADGNNDKAEGNYVYYFPESSGTLLVSGMVENNLTSTDTKRPLSAAMGKKLNDDKLGNRGSQTLTGGVLTIDNPGQWGKLSITSGKGRWVVESPPQASHTVSGSVRLNFKFEESGQAAKYISLPATEGNETVAYQGWVERKAQAVRDSLKNEILGGAGAAFDTLKELQNALGGDANFAATVAGKIAQAAPSGQIAFFAGNRAPTGWLKANGAAVSRTAYAALFAAIGTTYGVGDGRNTFNLPDLRGEFVRGWDDGRGVDANRALGSAQGDEIKSHKHAMPIAGNSDNMFENLSERKNLNITLVPDTDSNNVYGFAKGDYTATGGAETRPRNIALLACIKI